MIYTTSYPDRRGSSLARRNRRGSGVYYARQGFLVIAAWKNDSGNGHVAVVTDITDLQKNKLFLTDRNVAASWGVLNLPDLAQLNGPLRGTFGGDKRDDVIYAAAYIRFDNLET